MLHYLLDPRAVVAHPEITGLDTQGLAHGKERIEDEFLRHDPQGTARLSVIRAYVVAHDAGRTPIGAHKARKNADQSSLAGPVGPEQAEELPLPNDEVDPRERLQLAEALMNVAEFDRGGHSLGSPARGDQPGADSSSSETP